MGNRGSNSRRQVFSPGPKSPGPLPALGWVQTVARHGGDPMLACGAIKTMINQYQRGSLTGRSQCLVGGTGCSLQPFRMKGCRMGCISFLVRKCPCNVSFIDIKEIENISLF